jgi:2-pyrone-4,6-dicarboxylate lactonase
MTHAMKRGPFPEWIRETRRPKIQPPPGSCDCQFHIYGDPTKYAPKNAPLYDPPSATFEDAKGVLATLGIDRGVIVYPMPYDTDNRLLFDTLRALSPG